MEPGKALQESPSTPRPLVNRLPMGRHLSTQSRAPEYPAPPSIWRVSLLLLLLLFHRTPGTSPCMPRLAHHQVEWRKVGGPGLILVALCPWGARSTSTQSSRTSPGKESRRPVLQSSTLLLHLHQRLKALESSHHTAQLRAKSQL